MGYARIPWWWCPPRSFLANGCRVADASLTTVLLPWVFAATGALFVVVAVPLILRKVPPNRQYGFRTPTTLNNPRIWYAVNAATGWDFIALGGGLVALSVTSALGLLEMASFVTWSTVWLVLGTLASVVHGLWLIARLKKSGD